MTLFVKPLSMRLAGLLAASAAQCASAASAAPAASRWDKAPAGKSASALDRARDTIRPLYSLRGSLYRIRIEILQAGNPELRSALAPLAVLSDADLGFVAASLARAHGSLSHGRGQFLVVTVADALNRDDAGRAALKTALRRAAGEAGLKAGAPVAAARLDKETQARISATARAATASAAAELRPSGEKVAGLVMPLVDEVGVVTNAPGAPRMAADTPPGRFFRLGLQVDPQSSLAWVAPLREDVRAVPEVVEAVRTEIAALSTLAPELKGLAEKLPPPNFAVSFDIKGAHGAPPAVPLDPELVCRALWDASCARLATCNGAIGGIVMSPTVCDEGADALIDACIARNGIGYPKHSRAELLACLTAWDTRPCGETCAGKVASPPACKPFDAGAPPIQVKCGLVQDEDDRQPIGD